MSISSSIYANYAESVRKRWADELRCAFECRDWDAVARILTKLEQPTFFE